MGMRQTNDMGMRHQTNDMGRGPQTNEYTNNTLLNTGIVDKCLGLCPLPAIFPQSLRVAHETMVVRRGMLAHCFIV